MEKKSQKAKTMLGDLGRHIAGSFNWSKLAFIVFLFVVSTVSYIMIKSK